MTEAARPENAVAASKKLMAFGDKAAKVGAERLDALTKIQTDGKATSRDALPQRLEHAKELLGTAKDAGGRVKAAIDESWGDDEVEG
eukprot:2914905-Pyramimonas_sp.AAC.1